MENLHQVSIPVVFYPVRTFFEQFSQLAQLSFGFALGLAFSHSNITFGWILFWIFLYEFIVFIAIGKTIYYSPFFRIVYNFVFLASVLIGQEIYFGHTSLQDWLYPEAKSNMARRAKPTFLNKIENYFDKTLEQEEYNQKVYKLKKKYNNAKF